MTTLEETIKTNAAGARPVSVKLCRARGTVEIRNPEGEKFPILLEGTEADTFIGLLDDLVEIGPDVLIGDALKHLAKPYTVAWWH